MASACLSEELECPICLSLLRSPVTTPCGHNFCRGCLQALWQASSSPSLLSCPQCRSPFDARPSALATNSLLCRVLEQMAEEAREPPEGGQRAAAAAAAAAAPPVPCDACLGSPPSEATHSCLTCLASFCAEHLRPHLQSPAFRQHHRLLRPPLRDLPGQTCPEHGRLLDGYCPAPLHAALLCPDCRPRHQGLACPAPLALPQARAQQQLQLKKKMTELDGLNKKALQSLDQVQVQQKQTSGIALQKLDLLKSEFLEMIALIQEVEKECVKKVLAEEKRVLDKYDFVSKVLGKKKNEIQGERDQIEMVLSEDDDIAFLRKSAKLGQMQIKDVFIPKIDLDQKLIQTVFSKSFDLKETLKQYLTHPERKEKRGSSQGKPNLQTVKKNTSLNAPKGGSVPANSSWETSAKEAAAATDTKRRSRPAKRSQSPSRKERSSSRSLPRTQSETLETFLNKSREELLEFATKFSLDYNTAHEKVIISEKNTKMSVSDIPQNYSYHPHRFTYCSQVVAFQCFKKGIYYWEVEIEHSNFCGIGICYGSMPRQGVDSRLGRNSSSWCIEWFNARISAWHNDIEECLPNTKVQKIGVLLNCKGGFVIFFGVAEKMTLLHMFQAQFTEALYPAFWIFSSGTTISISQLK
ncbi:LOW QUALITY PROTEIN: E3 ubiquitin/ISG15 ligase TRIM25-like [Sceloporus undulatus]|uniref:LOW QUALITY PROTEIN: E3 ubiquitin/ISG15 ligase TRIM25-like n=1 Tax=Sceloporus undulatus TaxID=8520 RepID=UPI001C4CA0C0|nr:LOW QUALITY PROTEIN: E3 ubiquitin/ISG15 ligase TRIM25-like [Sceloporus undulatus]